MVRKKLLKHSPLVSVNIRTFNSGKTLAETLESVNKQSYSNIELMISDGGSNDDTLKIAKKYKALINNAKQLGDARYKLFTESKGEYVMSLDSDQVMDKNLIEECVKQSKKYSYDALIISEKSFIDEGTFLEKLIAYDKHLIDKDRSQSALLDAACPRFFKKNVLMSVPWPKKLSIFDDSILYRMLLDFGAKVGYVENFSIWHHEVKKWSILFKKFYRYGKGYFRALGVSPKIVTLHSMPRASYFRKTALGKPVYFFGLFLLYFVKAFAASLGALNFLLTKIIGKNI